MSASNSNSPFDDPSYSRERLELETRVLAAALRQSLEIGDTEGSSLAHEQIFLLLKASQEMVIDEPLNLPREILIDRGRKLPDIDWGPTDDSGQKSAEESQQTFAPVSDMSLPEGQAVTAGPGSEESEIKAGPTGELDVPSSETSSVTSEAAETHGESGAQSVESIALTAPESSAESAQTTGETEIVAVSEIAADAESAVVSEASDDSTAGAGEAAAQAESAALGDKEITGDKLAVVQALVSLSPSEAEDASYYQQLQVTDLADFQSIHLSFWRKLRPLLQKEVGLIGPDRLRHLKRLQKLWIAHDILCDPVTRADYDFRRMGLRGGEEEEIARRAYRGAGQRTQLRIGELLQCAGLLEQNELEIAADMHKAMPEMMFGTFLVKQGFVEEADLNCVLVGQQLLKSGDITVVQFQTVMIERSATGLDIGEMLLAKHYVTEAMLEQAYRNQAEDTLVKVPVVVASGQRTSMEAKLHVPLNEGQSPEVPSEVSGGWTPAAEEAQIDFAAPEQASSESAQTEVVTGGEVQPEGQLQSLGSLVSPKPERPISLGSAAPAWKDQLDWSSPDENAAVDQNVEMAATQDETSEQSEFAEFREVSEDEPELRSKWAAPEQVVSEQGTSEQSTSEQSTSEHAVSESEAAQESYSGAQAESTAQTDTGEALNAVPESQDSLAESVRAIAQIWAEDTNPVSVWARVQEPGAISSDNVFVSASEEELSENPFVDLQEAGQNPDKDSDRDDSQTGVHAASANGNGAGNLAQNVPEQTTTNPTIARVVEDDTFSEIETSGNLPSLGELELKSKVTQEQRDAAQRDATQRDATQRDATQRDATQRDATQRGTGDWQIMSVPGSALTSLFLDDEPEHPVADTEVTKEITGNMSPFVDDAPPAEAQQSLESTESAAAQQQDKAPELPPPTAPVENERRKRRRRTRH